MDHCYSVDDHEHHCKFVYYIFNINDKYIYVYNFKNVYQI